MQRVDGHSVKLGPVGPAAPDRLRPWLAPAGVALAGTGGLAYMSAELNFALLDLARFALVSGLLILPVGWLLVRTIRVPVNPPLARLGLAVLVGYPATVTLYFILGLLGLTAAYPFLVAACAVGGLAASVRRNGGWSGLATRVRSWVVLLPQRLDWGAIFTGCLVLVACTPWLGYLEPDGTDTLYRGYPDNLVHTAYMQELFRGVPPTQLPIVAGETFPRVHLLHHIFVMLGARYGGLDPLQSYFTLAPMVLHILLVMALCLIGRTITGKAVLGWVAAGSIYVVGPIVEEFLARTFAVGGPSISYFWVSGPSLSGLIAVATALACLALWQRAQEQGPPERERAGLLYLAGFAAGALYLIKAEFFVLFYPAFLLGLAFIFLRDRTLPALYATGVALATFGFFQLAWRAPSWARPVIRLGVYAEVRLIEIQRLLEAKRYAYQVIQQYLDTGGALWPVTILLTLVIGWRFIQLSPILPAYLYNRLRNYRSLALWEVVVILMFPLWLVIAFGLDAAELTGPPRGLLAAVTSILLSFVALALNGCLIGWFALTRWKGPRAALALSSAVLGVLILAAPVALVIGRLRTGDGLTFSAGEMAAFAYLAHDTPVDAVVVENQYPRPVVAAFAARRVVIERLTDYFPERAQAVAELYSTRDVSRAEAILRQYHVSYLLEYSEAPLNFDTSILEPAFDGGDVKVYRVRQP